MVEKSGVTVAAHAGGPWHIIYWSHDAPPRDGLVPRGRGSMAGPFIMGGGEGVQPHAAQKNRVTTKGGPAAGEEGC